MQTYSVRTTQLAQCVTVCDQYTIPTPDVQAGLRFTGVKRVANNMKLEAVEKMVPEAFIWAGDALVYECEQPEHGIRGGVDTVLDMYTCQADTATYNTPRGLNTEREDEQEPWPLCQPQVYSELAQLSSSGPGLISVIYFTMDPPPTNKFSKLIKCVFSYL